MSNLEPPTGDAVGASREINQPARGDGAPGYLAALAACEDAQAVLDYAHLLVEEDPDRLGVLAEAYGRRASAWAVLAEALPTGMPVLYCTALFVAASADAERARDCGEWAAERGSGETR